MRRPRTSNRPRPAARYALRGAFFCLLLGCLVAGDIAPTRADDRDLVLNSGESPFLFVILDTSGSMNWALTNGNYPSTSVQSLPYGSIPPGAGDDPLARGYQAKSAIYEVIRDRVGPNANIGFAHFSQPTHTVYNKHWLYTVDPGANGDGTYENWPDWVPEPGELLDLDKKYLPFPEPGKPVRFGPPHIMWRSCSGGVDTGTIASPYNDGRTDDEIRIMRLQHQPKLGYGAGTLTTAAIRYQGVNPTPIDFEVMFHPLTSGTVGDETLRVRVEIRECITNELIGDQELDFVPYQQSDPGFEIDGQPLPLNGPTEVLAQDWLALGMIGSSFDIDDHSAGGDTCTGWQSNFESTAGNQLAYPTYPDPKARISEGTDIFARGNLIPWDWEDHSSADPPPTGFELSNRDEFLRRLAPNIAVEGDHDLDSQGRPIPDFRIARYFENTKVDGLLEIKSEYVNTPPIAFDGSTPIGNALLDFKEWYQQFEPLAIEKFTEASYKCRARYVLLLTDGSEVCDSDPATRAAELRELEVQTIVVGFGPGVESGDLQAIADAGGTGTGTFFVNDSDPFNADCERFLERDSAGVPIGDVDPDTGLKCAGPIMAENRDDLVRALTLIVGSITEEPTTFSAASLPSAQSGTLDSVFLASFLPLSKEPTWPGTLVHAVRPIPLSGIETLDDCPAVTEDEPIEECFAWEAGEEMLGQLDGIGSGEDMRRIYWSRELEPDAIPQDLQLLALPEDDGTDAALELRYNLWDGLGIGYVVDDEASEAAAALRTEEVIAETLRVRTAPDPLEPDGPELEWVLGDIFHAQPQVLGAPSRIEFLVRDFKNDVRPGNCFDAEGAFDEDSSGYRCFFNKHRFRQRMVLAGANDGLFHLFDAGSYYREEREFSTGTGREVFAYSPRDAFSRLNDVLEPNAKHEYSVDGRITLGDVFIDPLHVGEPTDEHREWRTVAIAGLRRGGRSLYALDLTQPWPIETIDKTALIPRVVPLEDSEGTYIPACMDPSTDDCGPVPYGSVLWEFADLDESGMPRDDDPDGGNGLADLAFTWSQPQFGVIQVLVPDGDDEDSDPDVVDRFVAIFGGGLERDLGVTKATGDWLYMVDVETGKALYKRQLMGPAPASPSVVDENGDGLTDVIYIGTENGFLYKVDVRTPVELVDDDFDLPPRIDDPRWDPFPIFDTEGRPIYHEPSVFFVAERGRYALAFGTGNREDIFKSEAVSQRFYVFLDPGFTRPETPLDLELIPKETALERVEVDAAQSEVDFLLLNGLDVGKIPGYFFPLASDERVVSAALTLSGVTAFSTFIPADIRVESSVCITEGISNLYTFFALSGNALGSRDRFTSVSGVAAAPWAESGVFDQTELESEEELTPEEIDDLVSIRDTLMDQMPDNCRFTDATINILGRRQDTGREFLAPVPICFIQKNWVDF